MFLSKYGSGFLGILLILPLVACGMNKSESRSSAAGSGDDSQYATIVDGKHISVQIKESLASTYFVPCVGIESVKNVFTPADLYPASARCLLAEQYRKAIELYSLAGAYAAYDAQRIADDQVGAANTVLILRHVRPVIQSSDEVYDGFTAALNALLADVGPYCDEVRNTGKPNYHPEYMIRHSSRYLQPEADKFELLKKDFNADATWNRILSKYLHCP